MSNQIMKREKFNVMFTSEEKQMVIDKAIKYGYGSKLAEYIRDACIHEKLYIENVEGKKEILACIDEYIKQVRIYIEKVNDLLKQNFVNKEDILFIRNQQDKILEAINKLIKVVLKVLSTNSTPKFQKRLRFIEKYKVTNEFIDSILKKEFAVIQPSNLNIKRTNNNIVIIYNQNLKLFDIENLNYDSLIVLIDEQREFALHNNFYLLFNVKEQKIEIKFAKCFSDKQQGLDFYDEYKNNNEVEILDFFDKEG